MESILSVEIICCFILISNRPKTMSHISYIFQKKIHPTPPLLRTELLECIMFEILHTYISIYPCIQMRTFFLKFHLEAWQSACALCTPEGFVFIWSNLHNEAKYKVEQLPVLWNMENKSKQNVCPASCITSEFSQCISHSSRQLESCRSTITIENQLHFFDYFYSKIIYMENFWFGFVKVLSTD